MLHFGFEPVIPVFERAKTVHGLDRAATVIGSRASITIETAITTIKVWAISDAWQ
jgi:hypothetical protein